MSIPRCRPAALLLAVLLSVAAARSQTIFVTTQYQMSSYNSATGAAVAAPLTGNDLNSVMQMSIADNGRIFVSQTANFNAGVYQASNGAALSTTFLPVNVHTPGGIAVDSANNRLYVASNTMGTIGVFNATTGAVINATLVNSAYLNSDLWVANGRLYSLNHRDRVAVYDALTGAAINESFIPGLANPLGLTIDASNRLYVTSWTTGVVGVYDAITGATINASLITGLNGPRDVAVNAAGQLFVTNYSGAYYRVSRYNALTGALELPEFAINGGAITAVGFAPVPEPSTWALALGASALGAVAWRRRRRARADCNGGI